MLYWNATLNGASPTTQRLNWQSNAVEFWMIGGHYALNETKNVIQNWRFAPPDYLNMIPQENMQVGIILWLDQGKPPTDGKSVQVTIASMQYD